MASNRIGRINEAIREALAGLLRTVKDPRVTESMLTITHVDHQRPAVRPGVYQRPELPG